MTAAMACRVALLLALGCGGCDDGPIAWRRLDGVGPPARWGHSAIYDPKRDRTLVYGGGGVTGFLNDVWVLSSEDETWRQLDVAPGGPERFTPVAVLDEPRDRLLVLTGENGKRNDDAWALDLESLAWRQLPKGPPARFDASGAADRDRAWVYGGFAAAWPAPMSALDDLWELDLAAETWRQLPQGSIKPAARTNAALAFFEDSLYLVGGHDDLYVTPDTWRYLLAEQRWQKLSPAGTRAADAHYAYAIDPRCHAIWLSSGDKNDSLDTPLTDALTLGDDPKFVRLDATVLPPSRRHAVLTLDNRHHLILYGGWQGTLGQLGDTWILDHVPCPE